MSYRVDIPTLSTNEVYTLTFEYEGTEAIQLIVGDLTLETTDRRVVFTTTSPVNYIESNVNLINLNMYEGYYKSDDFGGEYTQESYIEGKSLVNHHDFNRCIFTVNDGTKGKWELLDDGFARTTTLKANYNHCRPKPTNYTSETTYTVATWVRNFNSEAGNVKFECFHYLDTIKTIKLDASTDTTSKDRGTHYYSTGQEGLMISVGKYSSMTQEIASGEYHQYMGNFGTNDGFVSGDNVEIFVMVLDGDRADDILNGLIQPFHGIGCAKSPKIISQTKHQNLVITDIFKLSSDSSSGATFDKETQTVTVKNSGRYTGASFWFQPQRWGYADYSRMCVEFDVVEIGKLKDGDNPYFSLGQNCAALAGYSSTTFLYEGDHVKVAFSTSSLLDVRSSLIAFNTNGSTGGINNKLVITNFTMYHIDYLDDVGTYDCCKLTTPDDLELHGLSGVKDVFDLTNGLVTKKIGKLTNCHELISNHSYNEDGGYYTARLYWSKVQNIKTNGNQTLSLCNVLYDGSYKPNTIWSHGIDKAYYLHFGGCTTLEEAQQYCLDNNLTILYELKEPITEQLPTPLNALKSYQNGSITTSSQQLVPTLTTTLPISNKFTTTNLTSGSTYNVYFDGTATKLDAGGTIITNPVSPCEVECGGTTLTIEGTDIQNVRVLETTNKNEVGSVNGTTDVELSRIRTKCSIHNYFDDYFQDGSQWSKDWNCSSVRDDNRVIITTDTFSYAGFTITPILSYGTYKFHCKVKVANVGDKYRVLFHGNPNGATNDTGGFAWAETTSTQLVEEINYVGYFRGAGIALFYGYSKGQVVEYYDISLIKLSDEDITGTDTSSINYSQVISDLEQPIKLRSLGTTYDSYNPVTGELTKRIGVSETNGSYSVLSSPIVIPSKYKMLQDNNIIPDSFPQQMNSGYVDFLPTQLLPNTTYTIFLDATTASGQLECGLLYNADWYGGVKHFTVGVNRFIYTTGNDINGYYSNTSHRGFRIRGQGSIINNLIMVEGEHSLDFYNPINVPQLYTNGQVKVYSDSEVYPTTILNGQSTNNYEINELNKSNNYTIRYEGECESINLANKSNTQGTNRIVKAGATSGNLTFVNDSGDINNVLLVQNDVREQKIKHFNGLQTVEVSRILIENQRNMSSQHYTIENGSHYDYQRILPHYIKVEPNETLYANIGQNWMDWCTIYQYDEDKNRLSDIKVFGGYGTTQFKDSDGLYKNIITLSDNTRYIRIVLHNAFTSTFTLSRGDFLPPSTLAYNQYQGQYIDLPQPVQLNSLPDGTCDTYNPITGEYVQNVGYFVLDNTFASRWLIVKTKDGKPIAQRDLSTQEPNYSTLVRDYSFPGELYDYQAGTKAIANIPLAYYIDHTSSNIATPSLYGATYFGNHYIRIALPFTPNDLDQWNYSYTRVNNWLRENPIHIAYKRTEPITTQLTPIEIPTFEGGILQLMTTDGKVFPMIEYSMPTNNRYDTSSWETGAVYTQRNMTEAYFNDSTTPMIPTETMTLTTDHISSGSIILNDNGNGLIVLKGNYTGRDIPYFVGMRSVEAIEVETTSSPNQPLFGKGGRK